MLGHQRHRRAHQRKTPPSKRKQQQQQQQQEHEAPPAPSSKGPRMRPARDVVARILWDEGVPSEHFIVGYTDRFEGVLELPFDAFNWADFCSLDHTEIAVPEHRIAHFRFEPTNTTVWHKADRIDDVFGPSAGPPSTPCSRQMRVSPPRRAERRIHHVFILPAPYIDDAALGDALGATRWKNSRTSLTSSSGLSIAAKWPPLSNALQCTTFMLNATMARAGTTMSFGKLAQPVGTVT